MPRDGRQRQRRYIALNNPTYLAIASDDVLRRANFIRHSRHADARLPQKRRRRTLTDEQVQILVREMRARWSKPEEVGNATPPPVRGKTRQVI